MIDGNQSPVGKCITAGLIDFIGPDVPGTGAGRASLAVDVIAKGAGKIISSIERIVFGYILQVKILILKYLLHLACMLYEDLAQHHDHKLLP